MYVTTIHAAFQSRRIARRLPPTSPSPRARASVPTCAQVRAPSERLAVVSAVTVRERRGDDRAAEGGAVDRGDEGVRVVARRNRRLVLHPTVTSVIVPRSAFAKPEAVSEALFAEDPVRSSRRRRTRCPASSPSRRRRSRWAGSRARWPRSRCPRQPRGAARQQRSHDAAGHRPPFGDPPHARIQRSNRISSVIALSPPRIHESDRWSAKRDPARAPRPRTQAHMSEDETLRKAPMQLHFQLMERRASARYPPLRDFTQPRSVVPARRGGSSPPRASRARASSSSRSSTA